MNSGRTATFYFELLPTYATIKVITLGAKEDIQKLKEALLAECSKYNYPIEFIKKAVDIAEKLHLNQLRKSGEPYFIHPLYAALEIAKLDIGEDAVAAALLHDTIEDCNVDRIFISNEFNPVVASLVEGVTKIDALAHNSNTRYTETLNVRKLIITAAKDIRVLLIKLADRLHNMKTIDALTPEKQIRFSDETLKVYVPLAEYIGVGKWKRELEDIAFRKKEPELYHKIKLKIESDRRIHNKALDDLIKKITKILDEQKLSKVKVYGRIKSVHSTYRKLQKKLSEGQLFSIDDLELSMIKDLIAISIVMDSDEIECYRVLGLIHGNFPHSAKDFVDYIAKPKPNGYRSIHTVIKLNKFVAEIQIKTQQMHEVNEFGPASHLAYKISGKRNTKATNEYRWVKDMNIWSGKDSTEDKFKLKAFDDKIYVITPKGRVIELQKGATPIDFAYTIHTEVGNRFVGAKVNGDIIKGDYKLQNGDVVEILTSKNPKQPSLEWLKFAHLNSTKHKIRHILTLNQREDNIQKGKEQISNYLLKKFKIDWFTLDSSLLKYLCGEFGKPDIDLFYLAVASGNLSKAEVLKKLVKKLNISQEAEIPSKQTKSEGIGNKKVIIEGEKDLDYKIAGCCKPIAGDEIVGLVTLRDGLKIHRKVCPNLNFIDTQRKLKAAWQ